MPAYLGQIDPNDFELTRAPVLDASLPPAYFFTSQEFYEREVESIFLREWLCVGRTDQLQKPGDYFTIDWPEVPVCVALDRSGKMHAFSPVCRHRSTLVTSGEGNTRFFQCPYHGWTYSLSGELVGAPDMDRTKEFDKSLHCLPSIKVAEWEGFLFINLDPECDPFGEYLDSLSEWLAPYGMKDMKLHDRQQYELGCNWKIYVDNTAEEYHVNYAHSASIAPYYPTRAFTPDDSHGTWELLLGKQPGDAQTLSGESVLPANPKLSEEQARELAIVIIYPNMVLINNPVGMNYGITLPLRPDRCRLLMGSCFPESAIKHPAFEKAAVRLEEAREQIMREDTAVCESSHRGLKSRFASRGRYSHRERLTHRLHNYVLDRVLG